MQLINSLTNATPLPSYPIPPCRVAFSRRSNCTRLVATWIANSITAGKLHETYLKIRLASDYKGKGGETGGRGQRVAVFIYTNYSEMQTKKFPHTLKVFAMKATHVSAAPSDDADVSGSSSGSTSSSALSLSHTLAHSHTCVRILEIHNNRKRAKQNGAYGR